LAKLAAGTHGTGAHAQTGEASVGVIETGFQAQGLFGGRVIIAEPFTALQYSAHQGSLVACSIRQELTELLN